MTDIPETIRRVRELSEAATEGPWEVARCGDAPDEDACGITVGSMRDRFGGIFTDAAYDECHHIVSVPDANLIAYYRTAAPLLADECERLRARVGVLEAFARFVDEVRQPPSMSAADIVADYEQRARAALKGGE